MRWAILVVVMVLSGCADPPAAEPDEDEDYSEFDLDDTAAELGVIRGVVVDVAIRPVAGVEVSIGDGATSVITNANGVFAFKDLQPGVYFVTATRAGYKEAQTSTEVQAGVTDPPAVRVRMERLPGTEPNIAEDFLQGHITCSWRVPNAGFGDGCLVFGNLGVGSTQRKEFVFEPGNILWVQTELAWVPSSLTAERLCSTVYDLTTTPSGEGNVNNAVCGASPLIRHSNQSQVKEADVDEGAPFEYVAYPDHLLLDVSGNVVVEQEFEVFVQAFYNFLPPEGWQFGRDGLPPVPT